jgi:hypothetical protein
MKRSHFCLSIFCAVVLFNTTVFAGGNEYAVQIVISNTQLAPTDVKFKGVTDINEESFTGAFKYKYTTGKTTNLSEATATRAKMIDAGFKDAFIVIYQDGVRTTNWAKTKTNTNTGTAWNGTTTTNNTTVNTVPTSTNTNNITAGTTPNTVTATGNTDNNTGTWTNATTPTNANLTNTSTRPNNAPNATNTTKTDNWTNTTNPTTITDTTITSNTWDNTGSTTTPPTNPNNNENRTPTVTPTETTVKTESTSSNSPKKGLGYSVTETEAEFPGGYEGLQTYLQENLNQSQTSKMQKGEWKNVFVSFVIDKTGKVKNPQIVSGINTATDTEVMRVMKMMPNWKPATIGTTAIEKQFVLPVGFYITASGADETTKVASKVN